MMELVLNSVWTTLDVVSTNTNLKGLSRQLHCNKDSLSILRFNTRYDPSRTEAPSFELLNKQTSWIS